MVSPYLSRTLLRKIKGPAQPLPGSFPGQGYCVSSSSLVFNGSSIFLGQPQCRTSSIPLSTKCGTCLALISREPRLQMTAMLSGKPVENMIIMWAKRGMPMMALQKSRAHVAPGDIMLMAYRKANETNWLEQLL